MGQNFEFALCKSFVFNESTLAPVLRRTCSVLTYLVREEHHAFG